MSSHIQDQDSKAEDSAQKSVGGQADKALEILEWVTAAKGQLPKLTEIVNATGIPKATTHRLLTLLRSRGYVTQDEQAGYAPGLMCFELGEHWARRFDLKNIARPHLESLNQSLGETVQLGIYDQGDVVYIDKLESPQRVLARPDPSSRAPSTVVATGRALLAFQPLSEVEVQLGRPLPRFTDRSPSTPDEIGGLLEDVRAEGYAINRETYRDGICGLAAPIRNSTGAVTASVGIIVPAHRFTDESFSDFRDTVVDTAVAISVDLGGPSQLLTSVRRR